MPRGGASVILVFPESGRTGSRGWRFRPRVSAYRGVSGPLPQGRRSVGRRWHARPTGHHGGRRRGLHGGESVLDREPLYPLGTGRRAAKAAYPVSPGRPRRSGRGDGRARTGRSVVGGIVGSPARSATFAFIRRAS